MATYARFFHSFAGFNRLLHRMPTFPGAHRLPTSGGRWIFRFPREALANADKDGYDFGSGEEDRAMRGRNPSASPTCRLGGVGLFPIRMSPTPVFISAKPHGESGKSTLYHGGLI